MRVRASGSRLMATMFRDPEHMRKVVTERGKPVIPEGSAAFYRFNENEPRMVDGRVEMIPEVGRALKVFTDAGLMAGSFDEEYGGMQLPHTVGQAVFAWFKAANVGTFSRMRGSPSARRERLSSERTRVPFSSRRA